MTTTYKPYVHRCWHDGTCCRHCGHVPRAHHADGRCLNLEERWEQIGLFQRTGLWTEPAAPATAQDVEETP